ncbi:hypothetical protein ACE6H2_013436 [Prunus campanulata]
MTTAWPFLLGVEAGTVPFGRAPRNREAILFLYWPSPSCFFMSKSFLLSEAAANEAKTTKKMSAKALRRGILIDSHRLTMQNTERERERERERDFVFLFW